MDLFWRDSLTCPTEQEYIEMVNNKTGGLLRLAVKLMQACSHSEMWIPNHIMLTVVITFRLSI
jgi:geranylgeranyl diphosphate synthase, type III